MELSLSRSRPASSTTVAPSASKIWVALSGSVMAHGLLIWGVGAVPNGAVEASVTRTLEFETLLQEAPPAVVAPEPEAPPPPLDWRSRGPKRAAVTPVEPPDEPARVAHDLAESDPQPDPTLLLANDGAAASTSTFAQGSDSGAAGPTPTPDEGSASGGAGVDRAELGSLARDYAYRVHRLIADSARRDYPRAALRARVEGRVLLAVTVDRNGRVTGVRVARTSGHDVLDRAAVTAVQTLRQVPAPPAELPWANEQTLPPLPVTYQLAI